MRMLNRAPSHIGLFFLLMLLLGGCASTRGSQEWVTSADLHSNAAVCPSRVDLDNEPGGARAGAYRDRIISECTKAINYKYNEFAQALSREAGLANLGTDLAAQVLSTAASVVDGADLAKKLAAGSALSLGIGSTINKDLFYKQTLPAIIASMDARRSKVLTGIARAQNEDPDASSYTLARAGHDLDLLQQAGSLAAAVSELNKAAFDNANKADEERQRVEALDIGIARDFAPGIEARLDKIAVDTRALESAGNLAALQGIAADLQLPADPSDSARRVGAIIRAKAEEAGNLEDPAVGEALIKKIEDAISRHEGGGQ